MDSVVMNLDSLFNLLCFFVLGFRKLTVMDFIKIVATLPEDVGRLAPPITCKLESTLGSVINSLASKSVHRIYVVAGDEELVGVITLRDVISCFIFEPPNYIINHFGFSAEEMLNESQL